MQYVLNTSMPLEDHIQRYLTAVRVENPEHYRVPVFTLYVELKEALIRGDGSKVFYPSRYFRTWELPVALFNKTIGDLKKVGIIGAAKGGEEVFLSNAAWELYTKNHAVNPFDAPASSTTPSTEVSK
jgi:hypothetical protein